MQSKMILASVCLAMVKAGTHNQMEEDFLFCPINITVVEMSPGDGSIVASY
jgi:hypothetical protein